MWNGASIVLKPKSLSELPASAVSLRCLNFNNSLQSPSLQSLWIRVICNRQQSLSSVPFRLWYSLWISANFASLHPAVSSAKLHVCLCVLSHLKQYKKSCAVLHTHRVKFCRSQNYRYPCKIVTLASRWLSAVLLTSEIVTISCTVSCELSQTIHPLNCLHPFQFLNESFYSRQRLISETNSECASWRNQLSSILHPCGNSIAICLAFSLLVAVTCCEVR